MPREFELRKEVVLAATPEQVWEAISTEAGNTAWFQPIENLDPGAANVLAWDPPKHLRVDADTHAFDYLIEARDGGTTVLRFVHSGVLDEDWSGEYEDQTGKGWDLYFHTLAAYFRHFAGARATYVEAEGPKVADERARALLRKELELGENPAVGDRARLSLDGDVVDAEVDYTRHGTLGLRTADGLVRFHLRDRIDLSIAVAHYVYDTEVDAARLTRAWEDWLNRVLG
ncbi:SRPBCC domain-containing protein [Amycolatopsis endophytica]|uniref:ATPase n=1 Tax=Amycolatopsis endophytica TaxID=860233 RepID=A0A853B1Q7_9PSEU|nr:SRPBCC domain-containing protein [Amycolatopsis endophytica]NYI88802.1 hypothetical protein [Amycolatopsis endophytica]